jgi:hypothetical protein
MAKAFPASQSNISDCFGGTVVSRHTDKCYFQILNVFFGDETCDVTSFISFSCHESIRSYIL